MSFAGLHDGQAGGRFADVLDLNLGEIGVHAPVVVVNPLPLPADAFLEAHEFIRAGARRFFSHGIPALYAISQGEAGFILSVVSFTVGARLVPLGFAAVGDAAIAGVPVDEVNRGATLHVNVDFIVIDDFHVAARVTPEIVRVRSAAIRVGVIGH